MPVTANFDVAVDFLLRYRPDEFHVLVVIDPDNGKIAARTFKPSEEDSLRSWLGRQTDAGRNVYYHVNRTVRMLDKKAERTDMASVDWLHVDVDPNAGEDLRAEQGRILDLMQRMPGLPKPTLIVNSGGGCQALWRLKEPIKIDGNLARAEDAKRYNIQIETLLGGDNCHNIDRVLRLPGTVNFPNAKKRKRGQKDALCTVMGWNDDNVYDVAEFTKAPMVQDSISGGGSDGTPDVHVSGNVPRLMDVEQLGPGVSARCKAVIVNGLDEETPLSKGDQSRSAWLLYVCCELVRAEIEDEVIYAVITDPDFKISESVLRGKSSTQVEKYAIRQIRRAKELNIDPLLEHLNATYIFVEDVGGRARVIKEAYNPALKRHDINYLLVDGFRTTWCNKLVEIQVPKKQGGTQSEYVPAGKWWLTHTNRRSASRVIFAPNEIHEGCLNLWRGFACEAIPGNCDLYLAHLRDVLCKGHVRNYNYLIKWMAFAVQYPGVVPQVAVVLRGLQGTGKGTFAKHFGSLFGCHYKHITNPKHVVGQFNGTLEDAVLVFADEAFVAGSKDHESNLKTLISEDTLNLENKGVMAYEGRNCCHLIMASNENWVVPVTFDDRRFFILDVSESQRCDAEYFAEIIKQMDEGGREALLHYLLSLDISDFNVRARPDTEEMHRQKMQSLSSAHTWWLQKLEDGKLAATDGVWTCQAINDQLIEGFATTSKKTGHGLTVQLANFLKEVCPPTWPQRIQLHGRVDFVDLAGRDQKRDRPKARRFPPLEECRDFWDEKFGKHEWDEILPVPDKVDDGEPF